MFERQALDDFQFQRLTQKMRLLRQADVDPADVRCTNVLVPSRRSVNKIGATVEDLL
jgi:hypothetical protein